MKTVTSAPWVRAKSGARIVVEPNHALPLVDLEIAFPFGAADDPIGKAGRTRMMTRVLRSGVRGMSAAETDEAFARLGARFSIETSMSTVRIRATVIERKLETLLSLLGNLIAKPAFRNSDLEAARRETLADFSNQIDSDSALAARVFREATFGKHAYGRSIVGTQSSVSGLKRTDLVARHRQVFRQDEMIVGFSGPRDLEDFALLVDRYLGGLPTGRLRRPSLKSATPKAGRRVIIVDKPDRSQVQVLIGGLGSRLGDPLRDALTVANTGFGGMFTSPLVQEVREKRGWSYSVGCRVGADRYREAWTMWSHPSADQATECISLQLRLLEKWVNRGVTQKQFRATKKYLVNGHCFDVDTAGKRLDARVDELVYGLSPGRAARFPERVQAVTSAQATDAVKKRIDPSKLTIVVVGDGKRLAPELAKLPEIKQIEQVDYRRVPFGGAQRKPVQR